jgi:pectinesterase
MHANLRRFCFLLLLCALPLRGQIPVPSTAAERALDAPGDGTAVTLTVAQDGSGDYRTIQAAIDAIPSSVTHRTVVHIRPGIYRERVNIPVLKPWVTLKGDDASKTVLTASANAAKDGGTFNSGTISVFGRGFIAENLTFENSFGKGSQAVALVINADRTIVRHCRLIGFQDTLYANGGRQLYEEDSIEGAVDFIFGNALAVFLHDKIHSTAPGYLVAQSRTTPDQPSGYLILDSEITGSGPATTFLARPWRRYSKVVFARCSMDNSIRPEGWDNWRNPDNELTAYFAEYKSQGAGAERAGRAPWGHELTSQEAAHYLDWKEFLGWDPAMLK